MGIIAAFDIAGQMVAEALYIGPMLEPAARTLGALNATAIGLHGAGLASQMAPSLRVAAAALDVAAGAASDDISNAASAFAQTHLGKAVKRFA